MSIVRRSLKRSRVSLECGFSREVEDMEERSEEMEESSNSCSTSTCSSSVRGKKRCTEMRSEKPAYLRQKGTIP